MLDRRSCADIKPAHIVVYNVKIKRQISAVAKDQTFRNRNRHKLLLTDNLVVGTFSFLSVSEDILKDQNRPSQRKKSTDENAECKYPAVRIIQALKSTYF